jgi:hypothetical protein
LQPLVIEHDDDDSLGRSSETWHDDDDENISTHDLNNNEHALLSIIFIYSAASIARHILTCP